mgnify:CR=1 FL=1
MKENVLGTRIRKLREMRKLTQEEMSERCGVSASCVSRWETGSIYPSRKNQKKIAEVLGITTDELFACPALEIPPDTIYREVIAMMKKMSVEDQRYTLEMIRVFFKYRNLT